MRVWIGLVSLLLLLLLPHGSTSAAPPHRPPTATTAPTTPAAPIPTGSSGVRIQCTTEGAELFLDGELMGQTPFKDVIPLAAGEHTIRVSRLGFTPHIDVFKIKAGQTTRIEVDLTPISGVLGITSSTVKDGPAVRVFIDDKFFGKAPLETEMALGNHQVRVERPGYYSESFAVKAEPGKRIDKDVDLKPLPADQNPYLVKQPQVKWYQKWWVWTIAAVGVAAVATAIIVPVVLSQRTICKEVDVCTTVGTAALTVQPQSLTQPLTTPSFVAPLAVPAARPSFVPSLTLSF
jgi:hypothetical protein